MITIETKPKETKSEVVTTNDIKVAAMESELKIANDRIIQMQDAVISKDKELLTVKENLIACQNNLSNSEKTLKSFSIPTTEQLIRQALDESNRIHGFVIMYILKLKELDYTLNVGSLNLKRVFLGDGFYEVEN